MKSNLSLAIGDLRIFPFHQKDPVSQECLIEKTLDIHSLISLELAKCSHIKRGTLKWALSLIDKLDSILGSPEKIAEYYGYYYQALVEILIACNLDKRIDQLINKKLSMDL